MRCIAGRGRLVAGATGGGGGEEEGKGGSCSAQGPGRSCVQRAGTAHGQPRPRPSARRGCAGQGPGRASRTVAYPTLPYPTLGSPCLAWPGLSATRGALPCTEVFRGLLEGTGWGGTDAGT